MSQAFRHNMPTYQGTLLLVLASLIQCMAKASSIERSQPVAVLWICVFDQRDICSAKVEYIHGDRFTVGSNGNIMGIMHIYI